MIRNRTPSAHDLQRQKVLEQSIYGIWRDADDTIELKLSPRVGGAKIKVWAVNDLSIIRKISSFCGLDVSPKRTHWQGFDLITNLEKENDNSFVNGVVNMPNNKRKNFASFKLMDGHVALLDFFYQPPFRDFVKNPSGSLMLQR